MVDRCGGGVVGCGGLDGGRGPAAVKVDRRIAVAGSTVTAEIPSHDFRLIQVGRK